MQVIKRDGSKEEFDVRKIENAITKAFKACGKDFNDKDYDSSPSYKERFNRLWSAWLKNNFTENSEISVEEIQDFVENTLCHIDFPVGKAYMLYREQHKQVRLVKDKLSYIHNYTESNKSATNLSNTDDNANASMKTAATMEAELYKDTNRLIQRSIMKELLAEIKSPYRDQYVKDLEHHIIYQHDETGLMKPYCSAYTLYPLLVDGTDSIDGTKNHAPKHLSSFIGQFQNLVFLLSAQKKGAGAYGEFFNFFSYFCEKEWGEWYYKKADVIITNEHCLEQRTIWLNKERTKTLLTFPVMTVCLLTDGKDVLDKEYKDFITTQWAEGDSFFVYLSENADSISSCCRLRNEITENTFSSTTGLTGVQTGSCNVMTLNLNRIVQDWIKQNKIELIPNLSIANLVKKSLKPYLESILDRVYDYQKAYKTGLYKMDKQGMFPQTKAGYINFDKLYCTIGVNGLNEAARFLGLTVGNNQNYMDFASWILNVIKEYNKKHSEKKFMYNLELVPAESLGVKNYNWDKSDGYWVPEDENLYNSYIYDAHDNTSILDKIAMQGGQIAKSIDGGQASHLNLEDNLSKEQYEKLLEYAVQVGNSYITFNVPQTQCDICGFIAKHPFDSCPVCGSTKVTQWSRVIGYLRPVKAWSEGRQEEWKHRYFAKKERV